ncbi:hypothetical protein F5Y18DRAFT_427619 [Xylariaceae sp. FL1019]|nr:hypothetical protein F5Y18DRAFT_427619 [Xylariaceae sp. FL1019]
MASHDYSVMPKIGFRWYSKTGRHFLKDYQKHIILSAINQSHERRTKPGYVEAKFTEMFEAAFSLIKDCETMSTADFWEKVGQRVPWIKNMEELDGRMTYALSIQIISARFFGQTDIWNTEGDYYVNREVIITESEVKLHKWFSATTPLTSAVDKFTDQIDTLYATTRPDVRESYVPYWSQSADNEGSAFATYGENYVPGPCLTGNEPPPCEPQPLDKEDHKIRAEDLDQDVEMVDDDDDDDVEIILDRLPDEDQVGDAYEFFEKYLGSV